MKLLLTSLIIMVIAVIITSCGDIQSLDDIKTITTGTNVPTEITSKADMVYSVVRCLGQSTVSITLTYRVTDYCKQSNAIAYADLTKQSGRSIMDYINFCDNPTTMTDADFLQTLLHELYHIVFHSTGHDDSQLGLMNTYHIGLKQWNVYQYDLIAEAYNVDYETAKYCVDTKYYNKLNNK